MQSCVLSSSSQFHIQACPSPVAAHHTKQNPSPSSMFQKTSTAAHPLPAALKHCPSQGELQCQIHSILGFKHTCKHKSWNTAFQLPRPSHLVVVTPAREEVAALKGFETKCCLCCRQHEGGHLPYFTQ